MENVMYIKNKTKPKNKTKKTPQKPKKPNQHDFTKEMMNYFKSSQEPVPCHLISLLGIEKSTKSLCFFRNTLHSVLRWFLRINDPCITFWSKWISDHYGRLAYRIPTVDMACGPRDFLTTRKPAPVNSAVLWHVNNQWPYNAVHIHRCWHYLIYIPKRTFACYIYSVNLNPFYIYLYMFAVNFEDH